MTNQTARLSLSLFVPLLDSASPDPSHLGQHLFVLDDVLVSGEQDVELPAAELRDEGSSSSRGPLEVKLLEKM